MPLAAITPPPGVVANGTQYSSKGRWVDSNLVRFQSGHLEPVGGWQRLNTTALAGGTVVTMLSWRDNAFGQTLAVATANNVHALRVGAFDDITPTGYVGATGSGSLAYGFGAGPYGEESFGDARTVSGLKKRAQNITMDVFGEDLVFCSSLDGKIYLWSPNSGGTPDAAAAVLSNAPTNNLAVCVTNERHVLAIGAGGDARKVQFSDQETSNTWAASATNLAGSITLQTGGTLLAGKRHRTDTILFTDQDVHRMYYIGAPLAYAVEQVGDSCGPLGPNAIVSASGFLAWMSDNGVFTYDGAVRPIPCEVHDFIYDNLNRNFKEIVAGGANATNSEIWWFFPTGDNTSNTHYVIWNYQDNVWSVGELSRQFWLDKGAFETPLAGDKDGFVYSHEDGVLSASPDIGLSKPYAETGPIEIGQGDKVMHATRIIPDEESNATGCVQFEVSGRNNPLAANTNFGTFTIDADGYTDARFTARQVQVKVEGVTDRTWKLGTLRVDGKTRGKR